MDLNDIQKTLKEQAAIIPDYELLTKTELANGYCDADETYSAAEKIGDRSGMVKNDILRSAYLAATLLRYWFKIFQYMQNSSSLCLEPIEFYEWLVLGLECAFYYRAWRDPYKAKYKDGKFVSWILDESGNKIPNPYYWETDPNAPDKIINRCIFSVRGKIYQFYNHQKRKGGVHKESYDGMLEKLGDSADYENEAYEEMSTDDGVYYLIQDLLKKGEVIEALVVDGIGNGDSFKSNEENVSEFNTRKLVKHLNSLTPAYLVQFCKQYEVPISLAKELADKLKKMDNRRYYKYIEKTLVEIRNSNKLKNYLLD